MGYDIYFPNHLLLYSLSYMSWYGVHTMHDTGPRTKKIKSETASQTPTMPMLVIPAMSESMLVDIATKPKTGSQWHNTDLLSYPIHSRFSSEVLDVRSNQIQSTDLYWIHHDKLLHSYPVHIILNTAYFLHLVFLPFWYISYAYFWLCFTDLFTCD